MPNKYKIFTSNASEESTYQNLVYPRNLACVKQGAISYVVVDSKFVKSDKKLKDCPLFYDDTEFYVMNDDSGKDTWGGVTTTGIYTVDTLITPEKQLVINQTKKEIEVLEEVSKEIDNSTPSPVAIEEPYKTNLFYLVKEDGDAENPEDCIQAFYGIKFSVNPEVEKIIPLAMNESIFSIESTGDPETPFRFSITGSNLKSRSIEITGVNKIKTGVELTVLMSESDVGTATLVLRHIEDNNIISGDGWGVGKSSVIEPIMIVE